MVRLILEQAKDMRTVVDAMSAVSIDVVIEISDKGFRAQARDQSTSWLVDVFMDKSMFTTYDVNNPIVFKVDLKDYSDFIKTARSDESLEINDNREKNTLDLKLKSNQITKQMSLKLQDVEDYKFLPIMERPFHSNARIGSELFNDAVKAAELGDDHVTLTHTKDSLHFESTTTARTAKATIQYKDNDQVSDVEFKQGKFRNRAGEEEDIPQVHVATYAHRYLKHVARLGKSDTILLGMGNASPIRLAMSFEGGKGHIAFAIAPRIQDDMA